MKFWPISVALGLLLTACGESGNPDTAPAANAVKGAAPDRDTGAVQTATREDVVEALRCHRLLSSAMVAQIASSDGPKRRFGAAISHWSKLIDQRAAAAGLSESERDEIRTTVLEDHRRTAGSDEAKTFTESCYAAAPSE